MATTTFSTVTIPPGGTSGNVREGGRGRGEGRRVGKGKKGVKDCGQGGKIGEGEK